jgi:hypothetical protein
MTAKVSLACGFISALTLFGCGKTDQPPVDGSNSGATTATPAMPATPEATTAVAEGGITTLDPAVLSEAKWTGAGCSLDTVDGNYSKDGVRLTSGKSHVFRGWILNAAKQPAGKFGLVFKGATTFVVAASTGVSRSDVGAFYKNPALNSAGFNFSTTLTPIPAGDYRMSFIIQESGHAHFCDAGKTLTVE